MDNEKVFLITGVSSGLGRAFASAALCVGHLVVGTLREENARKNFESEKPGFSKGIVLDVTDFDAIDPAVAEIERTIGPISVLVNNAGYGHEGVIEE
jgi:NAD(P)-dependent dehydrogenase (short-subunit alcohol dehydrogenase family)